MALPSYEQLMKASRVELKELIANAEKALRDSEAAAKEKAKTEFLARIEEAGFTFSELFGASPAAAGGSGKRAYKRREGGEGKAPVAPKYRHPENDTITWSGRGRQPDWIKSHVASGKSLDDLLINA
ncbi:H-NS histone family protein [Cereibacter changlensis]|uniref:H-NS histone family protein n=1 Tax=Cereibacter changlensis TaxID=402884 RepID=UPI00403357AF